MSEAVQKERGNERSYEGREEKRNKRENKRDKRRREENDTAPEPDRVNTEQDSQDIKTKSSSHRTHTRETVLEELDHIMLMIDNQIEESKTETDKISKKHRRFLRTLTKRVKSLKGHVDKVTKVTSVDKSNPSNPSSSSSSSSSSNPSSASSKRVTSLTKPVKVSRELAKFAGWPEDELRSRIDVTKYICNYINDNNLKDGQYIKLDNKLQKLLGLNSRETDKPLRWCDIKTGLIQNHYPEDEE